MHTGPVCRRRSHLLGNSIDSLPGNYIVRDIIERQHGTLPAERPSNHTQHIQARLKNMDKPAKDDDDETDYMDFVKPAAAALIGVLGGLLLAKGVKKLCDKKKQHDDH